MKLSKGNIFIALTVGFLATNSMASESEHEHGHENSAGAACEGYGPQAPRDIDDVAGTNKRIFTMAPDYTKMNLCNIHFHNNAEHKAKDFSICR